MNNLKRTTYACFVMIVLSVSSTLMASNIGVENNSIGLSIKHHIEASSMEELPMLKSRMDRRIGIQGGMGFKTIAGFGLIVSYYPSPKIGMDVAVGLGAQAVNFGARFKYYWRDANFSPYAGIGLLVRPVEIDALDYESTESGSILLDINKNVFVIPQVGLELRTDGGLILGASLGYAVGLNSEPYSSSNTIESLDVIVLDALYGSSISIGAYIGFSF